MFQARRNISTGIGFRLNPLEPFPESQLSDSDKPSEDIDERESCLRTWREGVLGGEGVAGNNIRVKGMGGLRVRVRLGGGDAEVRGRGRGRRVFELKTLRRGLRIVVVRGGSTLTEFKVDVDHRLQSRWDFSIGVGGKEKGEMGVFSEDDEEGQEEEESIEERGESESMLARGRYVSFIGVSGRAGERG